MLYLISLEFLYHFETLVCPLVHDRKDAVDIVFLKRFRIAQGIYAAQKKIAFFFISALFFIDVDNVTALFTKIPHLNSDTKSFIIKSKLFSTFYPKNIKIKLYLYH